MNSQPTMNQIITDIAEIAFKWPKETREKVFRAVNSHDALVSALEQVREQLDYASRFKQGEDLDVHVNARENSIELIDKALNQAQG